MIHTRSLPRLARFSDFDTLSTSSDIAFRRDSSARSTVPYVALSTHHGASKVERRTSRRSFAAVRWIWEAKAAAAAAAAFTHVGQGCR